MTDEEDRLRAAAQMLATIHDALRRDLAAARRDPRVHCLAFCSALGAHHRNEDAVFPRVEAAFPEAAPLLRRLRAEHERIARQIEEQPDADTLELMAAELEEHFALEERELVPLISRLR
ncbi:hemerythrin domain-containing protein [Dactylosporangium sp. CS-033363]|uniref:hemerythrin domain-containing protein n=1 Tax=Dactylosporangium sp. CS-033363 TaxID=3239935 RepID=UPI003D8EE2C4